MAKTYSFAGIVKAQDAESDVVVSIVTTGDSGVSDEVLEAYSIEYSIGPSNTMWLVSYGGLEPRIEPPCARAATKNVPSFVVA